MEIRNRNMKYMPNDDEYSLKIFDFHEKKVTFS